MTWFSVLVWHQILYYMIHLTVLRLNFIVKSNTERDPISWYERTYDLNPRKWQLGQNKLLIIDLTSVNQFTSADVIYILCCLVIRRRWKAFFHSLPVFHFLPFQFPPILPFLLCAVRRPPYLLTDRPTRVWKEVKQQSVRDTCTPEWLDQFLSLPLCQSVFPSLWACLSHSLCLSSCLLSFSVSVVVHLGLHISISENTYFLVCLHFCFFVDCLCPYVCLSVCVSFGNCLVRAQYACDHFLFNDRSSGQQ